FICFLNFTYSTLPQRSFGILRLQSNMKKITSVVERSKYNGTYNRMKRLLMKIMHHANYSQFFAIKIELLVKCISGMFKAQHFCIRFIYQKFFNGITLYNISSCQQFYPEQFKII